MNRIIYCSFFWLIAFFVQAQVSSPTAYFDDYGKSFTPHHKLVSYFEHVSEESPMVQFKEYGRTNQNRPLIQVVVSTSENIENLESIRKTHMDAIKGEDYDEDLEKVIVWLSFGVHGNEAGATESAIQTLYDLVSKAEAKNWLSNTIVIIDPCLNPDGNARYKNWQRNIAGNFVNASREHSEHNEPWPSGRVNHYQYDLNRDWAWATQIETQHRIKQYNQWLPHIHSDVHEQYPDNPYYFAPAAEPYHPHIHEWQIKTQTEIGKNHAHHFDENGDLYFTREVFDLFYPSYGDTYPTFCGAVGMTYEQAGHGISGRAIVLANGDTLKIQDRIDHHKTTAISTVESSSDQAKYILKSQKDYFKDRNIEFGYKAFVLKNNPDVDLEKLKKLLNLHEIEFGYAKSSGTATGYTYNEMESGSMNYQKGDLVIPTNQLKAVLVHVLFEPEAKLTDSLTYDITAWSLPFAYGVEAVASNKAIAYEKERSTIKSRKKIERSFAYAIKPAGEGFTSFLVAAHKAGIQVRLATKKFKNKNEVFPRGSLLINTADNKHIALIDLLNKINLKSTVKIYELKTGWSTEGPDLGSDRMKLLSKPNVCILGGEKTDPYNFGQIWHYFDSEINYPYTSVDVKSIGQVNLNQYNTLVLPELMGKLSESDIDKITKWVNQGGHLISIGQSIDPFTDKFEIITYEKGSSDTKTVKAGAPGSHKLERYEDAERASISGWMPGAIIQTKVDNSHPLGYGLGDTYATLKTSTYALPTQEGAWNICYTDDLLRHAGFIGYKTSKKLKNSTVHFTKTQGGGQVTALIDNPLYRSFWQRGKRIFSNAIFLVN